MRNLFRRSGQPGAEKRDWLDIVLKGKVLPILGFALVIAISVGLGILYYQGRFGGSAPLQYIEHYIRYYGYPAVFGISMIWNSTVLVPIPSFWIYYPLAAPPFQLFPPLLGLAGGGGAAVGELTAYMAGYSGRVILQRRRVKMYTRVEGWMKKRGLIVAFVFNLVPFFPFDLVGIAAGASRFTLWKFYLACLAGRSLAYGFIAFLGSKGWALPPLPFLNPPE